MPLSHAQEAARIHEQGCACRRCRHPELREEDFAQQLSAANSFAVCTFIGLALGMAMAALVDVFVDGPGVLSIFGIGL